MIRILFLAADPTDESRLRLGEEVREIQEKLQLAKLRDKFILHQQLSVRPSDVSQALLDFDPRIVHFSGHGGATGALYIEDLLGKKHPIEPEALASLFEQFANQVGCVILNACYSEIQAQAIARHVEYVIGMNQAIGDRAAIAFSVGFYQALGAGRSIEEAYKLGCVQIRLQGITEHPTPVLNKKKQPVSSDNSKPASASVAAKHDTTHVQVIVEGDPSSFDESKHRTITKLLAAVLDIDESMVRILRVERGSTKITIEIPKEGAEKLHLLQAVGPDDFNLFRRAVEERNEESWVAIVSKYRSLVAHWLAESESVEDTEFLVNEAFLIFWESTSRVDFSTNFKSIRQVLTYLKYCAAFARTGEYRRKMHDELDWDDTFVRITEKESFTELEDHIDYSELWNRVAQLLKSDQERVVLEMSFVYGLTPREILTERPDLFPDVRTIYRVKQTMLNRLRRGLTDLLEATE